MAGLVEMFRSLRLFAASLASGISPEGMFRDINIDGAERTAAHLREVGSLKGQKITSISGRSGMKEEQVS